MRRLCATRAPDAVSARIVATSAASIAEAAALLRSGALVAFPTETVYGLGGDAESDEAVRRVFAAKGRPADHPVIVHVASIAALAVWGVNVPAAARGLAERFWPGPLTLIVKKASFVHDAVTGEVHD